MAKLLNNTGLQYYANKMCNAENRKVGSKSLPTALNDIDTLIDQMKTQFANEYGSSLDMVIENDYNVFTVGTGVNIDRKNDVENSFTDIALSGRSLVNHACSSISDSIFYKQGTSTAKEQIKTIYHYKLIISTEVVQCASYKLDELRSLKLGSVYTLVVDVVNGTNRQLEWFLSLTGYNIGGGHKVLTLNPNCTQKIVFPFQYTENTKRFAHSLYTATESTEYVEYRNLMILEGDWSNKPVPRFFKNIHSLGQSDNAEHGIIIASLGRNICPVNTYNIYDVPIGQFMNAFRDTIIVKDIPIKPNTKYNIYLKEAVGNPMSDLRVMTFREKVHEREINHVNCYKSPNMIREYRVVTGGNGYIVTENDARFLTLTTGNFQASASTLSFIGLQIVEGETVGDIESYKEDKVQISLNEPMRGLPNGVKDTIEKINGKWKLVRRCGEIIFDGSQTVTGTSNLPTSDSWSKFGYQLSDCKNYGNVICDKLTYKVDKSSINPELGEYVGCTNGMWKILFQIKKVNNFPSTVSEVSEYMRTNPMRVIYELETPVIEDVDPITLQCWKNGTIVIDDLISTNSTHTVALNKPAQIKRNIEELTDLRNRVKKLESMLETMTVEQYLQSELLRQSINLDK